MRGLGGGVIKSPPLHSSSTSTSLPWSLLGRPISGASVSDWVERSHPAGVCRAQLRPALSQWAPVSAGPALLSRPAHPLPCAAWTLRLHPRPHPLAVTLGEQSLLEKSLRAPHFPQQHGRAPGWGHGQEDVRGK